MNPYTHEQALRFVNLMLQAVQKLRSNQAEVWGVELDQIDVQPNPVVGVRLLQDFHPWLFGPQAIIAPLTKIAFRAEVTPSQFANFVYIAQKDTLLGARMEIDARQRPEWAFFPDFKGTLALPFPDRPELV